MKTQSINYSEIKPGDSLFFKEGGHERRKLNFNEVEVVKSARTYEIKNNGNGPLVLVMFESGRGTWGFENRTLEKVFK